MFLRLTRLRFIIVRGVLISMFIILFLQIMAFLNHDGIQLTARTKSDDILLSKEKLFWKKLSDEDKQLTDKQRIEQIELSQKQTIKKELNWTNIFFDIYARKIEKLNERDAKTPYKHRSKQNEQNIQQKTFEIFEETPVFQRPKFCSSTRIFHPECPFSNCQWSCKKPSINDGNLRRASVFHHVDINQDEMREKLGHRSYHDIWILWVDEANRELEHLNQYQFNWTLSFRQDSEVSIGSYGLLIRPNKKGFLANKYSSNNSDFLRLLIDRNIRITDITLENRILTNYRYRHKNALWFVSNCFPKRRLEYYAQLKDHFPVQAFGSCVSQKCDRNKQCEHEKSQLALFYLAFESQTCTDYITEKFWRALYYGMIPIVLGPSKQSYLDLGIPQSAFIHITDFQSAKELANHLNHIATDYFLYREYFQWLNQYEIFFNTNDLEPIRMCELCMRLNMQKYQDHSFYTDIHQWHRAAC